MAQVKCPNGHFYNDDIYPKCPYCGKEPPSKAEVHLTSHHDWKSIATKAAATVCAVIAIGSFSYVQSIESDLSNAKNDQKKITQNYEAKTTELNTEGSSLNKSNYVLKSFRSFFGSYDENFYADVPIFVIKSGGETKKLNIHGEGYAVAWLDDYTENSFASNCATDIVAKWSGTDSIEITSGSTKGFNILHVRDSKEKSFDVLIIVK